MYGRYSSTGSGNMSVAQTNRNRVKNIVILLLAAAVITLAVIGIPAVQNKNDSHDLYIRRMQIECDEAVTQTSKLSRTAGAPTAAQLAQIRCNLYAIRAINDMSVGQNGAGSRLIEESEITNLLNEVDTFLSVLITGMDTGEKQTTLQSDLIALQEKINLLQ